MPPPNAHRHQPIPAVATFQLVQNGNGEFGPGSSERMAQGNRAAVDVDPLGRQRTLADNAKRLARESFVEFNEVDVFDLEAGLLERFGNGLNRPDPHDLRRHTRHRVGDKARPAASTPTP